MPCGWKGNHGSAWRRTGHASPLSRTRVVYPPTCSTANVWKMSTPPMLLMGHGLVCLFEFRRRHFIALCFVYYFFNLSLVYIIFSNLVIRFKNHFKLAVGPTYVKNAAPLNSNHLWITQYIIFAKKLTVRAPSLLHDHGTFSAHSYSYRRSNVAWRASFNRLIGWALLWMLLRLSSMGITASLTHYILLYLYLCQ